MIVKRKTVSCQTIETSTCIAGDGIDHKSSQKHGSDKTDREYRTNVVMGVRLTLLFCYQYRLIIN